MTWLAAVTRVAGLIHAYGPGALQVMRLVAPAFPGGAALLAAAELLYADIEKFKVEFAAIHGAIDPATIPATVTAPPAAA